MVATKPKSTSNLHRMLKFDVKNYHQVNREHGLPDLPVHAGRLARAKHLQIKIFGDDNYLIGVDEVGRGCLAGPVVSAAVLIPLTRLHGDFIKSLSDLDDSKKIKAAVRERLADYIKSNCHFAVASATPREIDEINILNASLLSMHRAISALVEPIGLKSALVLVDGNRQIKELPFAQVTIVKGDSHSASIAAASVVAKVHRDALMVEMARTYPHYGFESHKGYGSRQHRLALNQHGHCPEHRMSFRLSYDDMDFDDNQNALCDDAELDEQFA